MLREDEISKQHEEDADDEADVEVDRRPALHALPVVVSSQQLSAATWPPQLAAVVNKRTGSDSESGTAVGGNWDIDSFRKTRSTGFEGQIHIVRWRAFDLTRSLDWFICLIGYISSELNASLVYGYYTQR